MKGMMMHQPLLVSEILEFGAGAYPRAEIVSVRTEGDVHRETLVEFRQRTIQLAHGLKRVRDLDKFQIVQRPEFLTYDRFHVIPPISNLRPRGTVCLAHF